MILTAHCRLCSNLQPIHCPQGKTSLIPQLSSFFQTTLPLSEGPLARPLQASKGSKHGISSKVECRRASARPAYSRGALRSSCENLASSGLYPSCFYASLFLLTDLKQRPTVALRGLLPGRRRGAPQKNPFSATHLMYTPNLFTSRYPYRYRILFSRLYSCNSHRTHGNILV